MYTKKVFRTVAKNIVYNSTTSNDRSPVSPTLFPKHLDNNSGQFKVQLLTHVGLQANRPSVPLCFEPLYRVLAPKRCEDDETQRKDETHVSY